MDVDGGGEMEVDMGYETHPLRGDDDNGGGVQNRRREDERQRRASIKAILADESITPHERRRSIQHLMDGRRSSIGTASVASASSGASTGGGGSPGEDNPYGYGDVNPYGYGDDNGPTPRNNNQQQQQASMYNADGTQTFHPPYEGDICHPVCNENTKRAEMTRPHCEHYDRKCSMVAPCCGATFGCRICHDDSPVLPPKLIMKQATHRQRYPRSSSMPGSFTSMEQPEDTHHTIDRFAVKEVICRECYTKQNAKT